MKKESWLKCICALRNAIAHHARIWNRRFPYKPLCPSRLPSRWAEMNGIDPVKLYPLLCALQYIQNAIHPANHFVEDFKTLLTKYPMVDTAAMGFPTNWQDEPLWK